jgi:hypothetical protein
MQIYSNAFFSKEAGDVVGYELALHQLHDHAIDARLYIYQGEPNEDGISMSGKISDGKLTVEGSWVQHLIEHPSEKEIVKTQLVRIEGMLDSTQFRGTIRVEGVANPIKFRLKRVGNIWMCKR